MRPSPRRTENRPAFTLVEIMVVLVVLAIAAVMVVPYVSTSSSQAVSAAQVVASDLQYAQSQAITTQLPTTVTYDTSHGVYTLSNQSGTLKNPMKGQDANYMMTFNAASGFGNVTITSATFGAGHAVTFDSTGAPDNAGTVVIRAGNVSYTVSVAAATGNVTVTGG